MDTKVGLETVVSFFPETVVKAKDRAYLEPAVPKEMRGVLRFPAEVRMLKDENAAEILAERVARKALDRAGLKPSDIDYIISNNGGGKLVTPMVGCYIHHKLGFPKETPVLNIQNACASFVDACENAWNLVLAGKYRRILVVTVQVIDTSGGHGRADLTDPFQAILGDGAGAAIVSSENLKCEFLSYYNRTFGEVYDWSALNIRAPLNPGLKGAPDQPPISNYFYSTPEFFNWWLREGPQFGINGMSGALKKANLNLDDIDIVIFHQPVDMIYDMWIDGAEKAGLSRSKWKHTWEKYGNLGNSVIPANLAEFWQNGDLKRGMIMVWITIGAGAHAPTMIARWLG